MYVEILTSVLGDMAEELTGDALLCYALVCRAEMLDPSSVTDGSSMSALTTEVAYDRALVRLCEAHGVRVLPANFVHPKAERARLEDALARSGVDLEDLGHRLHLLARRSLRAGVGVELRGEDRRFGAIGEAEL